MGLPLFPSNMTVSHPRSEIFGPILPIVPVQVSFGSVPCSQRARRMTAAYKDYQEALDHTNAGDHPLALYIYTDNAALKERSTPVKPISFRTPD